MRFKAEREAIIQQAIAAKRPLTWHEQETLFRWYSVRVDKYLDTGHGHCWLKQPEIASIAVKALRFHEKERFDLRAWTVMPNHVHVVVHPYSGWTLSAILKSWKGYSSWKINKELGRTGMSLWQEESFDHLIRDDEDLERCCHYTNMNPVNAHLCAKPEDWPWGSLYRE